MIAYQDLWRRLTGIYDEGEAKAIVRMVLDVRFDLSVADIFSGKVNELSSDDKTLLEKMMQRLEKGEPVQYVLGVAEFCGQRLHMAPGVLIPRPETAELCQWIGESSEPMKILDIGTGSGCIAITLALKIPNATVMAWDISDEALRIAAENARQTGVHVIFEKTDALDIPAAGDLRSWDIIVSNPPYIDEASERDGMAENVLGFEPHSALFVPGDDPLLFYRAIARYARASLRPAGSLYFEANPVHIDELCKALRAEGFRQVDMRRDQFGKKRFVKACLS